MTGKSKRPAAPGLFAGSGPDTARLPSTKVKKKKQKKTSRGK